MRECCDGDDSLFMLSYNVLGHTTIASVPGADGCSGQGEFPRCWSMQNAKVYQTAGKSFDSVAALKRKSHLIITFLRPSPSILRLEALSPQLSSRFSNTLSIVPIESILTSIITFVLPSPSSRIHQQPHPLLLLNPTTNQKLANDPFLVPLRPFRPPLHPIHPMDLFRPPALP